MGIMSELNSFMESEFENTPCIGQDKIRDKYTEQDIKFAEFSGRMGAFVYLLFYKDGKYELCNFDDIHEDFSDTFPMTFSFSFNDNTAKKKYIIYDCGFGCQLYVDKTLNKQFNDELIKESKKTGFDFVTDIPFETFRHGYWLSIAKKVLNKNLEE